MPARPTHSEAALRRLELLSAELAGVRETAPLDDVPDAGPEVLTGELPVPGRHAARLPVAPRGLPSMPAIQPAHLALVVLLVAAGLLLAAWWVVGSGGRGEAVPPLTATSPVAGLTTPGSALTPSPTASTTVVVDVAGDVRHPGIVVLRAGARVVDALRAAGGPLRGTDLSTLNQARLLVDGEQIVVGAPAPAGVAASGSAASVPAAPLVNLNSATQAQLESLPGIGPVTAQSIIDWRAAHGRFSSVEELLEVDGIGDATLADLAPYVTL